MKISTILLGFLIIIMFLISGSGLADVSTVTKSQKQTTTNLNIWYFDNGSAETFLRNQIGSFATSNGITYNATKIDPSQIPSLIDQFYYNDSIRPDLIEVKGDWIPQLATKNYIISVDSDLGPINTYINSSLRALSYYPAGATQFHVYAYPYSLDTIMGFANKQILSNNNAPIPTPDSIWSWSDWLKAVSLTNNQINLTDPHYGFSFTDVPGSFDAILYGMGGRLFTNLRVDKLHFGINSTASTDALQLASDLVNTRHLTPALDQMGTTNTRTLFEQGKVGLIFDYFTSVNEFLASDEFKSNNNLVIFQVPQITAGMSGAPLIVDGFAVSGKATGDVLAKAKSLANLLSGADVQQGLTTNYLKIPTRTAALQSVLNDVYYDPFFLGLMRSYQTPISNFWYSSITNYAGKIWVYLRGEPALATQAALGIELAMDQIPINDTSPLYLPANYPAFFTTQTTTSKSSPGFDGLIIIPILLSISIVKTIKNKHLKQVKKI